MECSLRLVSDRAHRLGRRARGIRANGFSMIELMITIAVAAILLVVATPGFTAIINSNRLTGSANEMVATLQTARMEAVRRNRSVTVCSSADGEDCEGEGAWIVLDADGNLLRVSTFDERIQSTAGVEEFVFGADGLARATSASGLLSTAIDFCIDTGSPAENARTVSVRSGSRISTVRAQQACP